MPSSNRIHRARPALAFLVLTAALLPGPVGAQPAPGARGAALALATPAEVKPSVTAPAPLAAPARDPRDINTLRRIEQLQREQALNELEAKVRGTGKATNTTAALPLTLPEALPVPGYPAPETHPVARSAFPVPGAAKTGGAGIAPPAGDPVPAEPLGNGFAVVSVFGIDGRFSAELGRQEDVMNVIPGSDLGAGWRVASIDTQGVIAEKDSQRVRLAGARTRGAAPSAGPNSATPGAAPPSIPRLPGAR